MCWLGFLIQRVLIMYELVADTIIEGLATSATEDRLHTVPSRVADRDGHGATNLTSA